MPNERAVFELGGLSPSEIAGLLESWPMPSFSLILCHGQPHATLRSLRAQRGLI